MTADEQNIVILPCHLGDKFIFKDRDEDDDSTYIVVGFECDEDEYWTVVYKDSVFGTETSYVDFHEFETNVEVLNLKEVSK